MRYLIKESSKILFILFLSLSAGGCTLTSVNNTVEIPVTPKPEEHNICNPLRGEEQSETLLTTGQAFNFLTTGCI